MNQSQSRYFVQKNIFQSKNLRRDSKQRSRKSFKKGKNSSDTFSGLIRNGNINIQNFSNVSINQPNKSLKKFEKLLDPHRSHKTLYRKGTGLKASLIAHNAEEKVEKDTVRSNLINIGLGGTNSGSKSPVQPGALMNNTMMGKNMQTLSSTRNIHPFEKGPFFKKKKRKKTFYN